MRNYPSLHRFYDVISLIRGPQWLYLFDRIIFRCHLQIHCRYGGASMSKQDLPNSEHDDILDNIPDAAGEDEFLYGDKKPPDHDPGGKSGCLATLLILLLPVAIIAGGYYYLAVWV